MRFKDHRKTLICLVAILWTMGTMLRAEANSGNNGGQPPGQPFQFLDAALKDIFWRVVTLEDKVAIMTTRVGSLEGRVMDIETAVALNTTALGILAAQVTDLEIAFIATTQDLYEKIGALEVETLALKLQIQDNTGDIASLKQQVVANVLLIASLTQRVNDVENGVITLEEAIQAQLDDHAVMIADLEMTITSLEEQVSNKQDLINGTCPEGFALREVLSDGNVICEEVSAGGDPLSVVTVLGALTLGAFGAGEADFVGSVILECPEGYLAISGGYYGLWREVVVRTAGPVGGIGGERYVFAARNNAAFETTVTVRAVCVAEAVRQ